MKTEVLTRNPPQFDMCGQRLATTLRVEEESISTGLAKRLLLHALRRLVQAGFRELIEDWSPEVYTMDGDERPADRSYCVRFLNPSGGYVEVIGILTNKGWPTLDHGFAIGEEARPGDTQ